MGTVVQAAVISSPILVTATIGDAAAIPMRRDFFVANSLTIVGNMGKKGRRTSN